MRSTGHFSNFKGVDTRYVFQVITDFPYGSEAKITVVTNLNDGRISLTDVITLVRYGPI